MKICGLNENGQLGEESNTKNIGNYACISPPCDSQLDVSSLLSFSISSDHSVNITKENRAFAFGSNEGFRIIPTLPEIDINHEILIQNKNGNLFNFLSAVCGDFYTLYLISIKHAGINQLAYANRSINSLLFLNLNGHNPQYLFGGENVSAAIDSEGSLFIITNSISASPDKTVKPSVLPNNEKSICVACCNSFVVVLSSTGLCFFSSLENDEISFTLVEELKNEEVVEISGTCNHCLAVCKSGKVFGYGSNLVGCLGLGTKLDQTAKFIQIKELEKSQVIHASAGMNHSLFVTSEGKLFACGSNYYGQLFLNNELNNDIFYTPIETTIQKGATFCIAGNCVSAVFVGCEPPKNTPNQVVKTLKSKQIENQVDVVDVDKDKLIAQLKKQNVLLLNQLNQSKDYFNDLKNENSMLESQIKQQQNIEKDVKIGFSQIKFKLDKIKNLSEENNSLKEEVNRLKHQISQKQGKNESIPDAEEKDEENSLLREEQVKLKMLLDEKEKEISLLKEDQIKLKAQLNEKEEENEAFKSDQIKLKAQLNEKENENAILIEKLNEIKKQIKKTETKTTKIQILDVSVIDSLKKEKIIDRGATSDVWKVSKQEFFALKIFDAELCKMERDADNESNDDNEEHEDEIEIDINKMRRFLTECEILSALDHPNIIKTYGFCFGDKKHLPSILLELCPSNLKKRIKTLKDQERVRVILEIVSAMKAIHKAGIFHRDLKLENILLDKENHVKLCDFGLCTLIDNDSLSSSRSQMSGTLSYMAPEIIKGNKNYNEKVDVYSFGVVTFIVLTKGEYPNIGLLDVGLGKMAEIPETVTQFSKELIQKCWSFEASNRPSFEEIWEMLNNNINKII